MARILSLEECPNKLRNELQSSLRVCDEAVVLPAASRSCESGAFKNVVFRLSGTDGELDPDVFSPAWFAGVSAVVVPTDAAERLLREPSRRAAALQKLKEKIPSEMADSDLQVGPALDADEDDRDKDGWVAGFDSGSCCVGLYSARQSRAPEAGLTGMNRVHSAYYLVCKAGGGLAAQKFHARITSSLRGGKTLDQCFEEGASPGPQALRRVTIAAQRMRKRILALAAEALGFATLDTISDNAAAAAAPHRGCIPTIDVTYNCLRRVEGAARSTWQYSAGCVDAQISQGLMASSNLAEGFIAFTSTTDEFRVQVRNEAHNTIPFVTQRIKTNRDIATQEADAHKKARAAGGTAAHPDDAFVAQRFAWKAKNLEPADVAEKIEPPSLWGSHQSESFLANWARELGVATCKVIRMAPEVVAVSAMEPAKLRASVKRVQEALGAVKLS
jgi:hypothetical protein